MKSIAMNELEATKDYRLLDLLPWDSCMSEKRHYDSGEGGTWDLV